MIEGSQAPSVVVSGSSSTLNAGQTDTITFTFSEAVTGFNNADVSVVGGTLSTITATANPDVYTAAFTPSAGVDTQTATIHRKAHGSTTAILAYPTPTSASNKNTSS